MSRFTITAHFPTPEKSHVTNLLTTRKHTVVADDNNEDESQKVLDELENIDDECDALGITFVKIDNPDEATEYGINHMPALLYFEKGIPTIYEGKLKDEMALLKWLEQQTTSDEIEDITDEMLDLILEKMPYVAVLFCKLF